MTHENTENTENKVSLATQVRVLIGTRSVAIDSKNVDKIHATRQSLEVLHDALVEGRLTIADTDRGVQVAVHSVEDADGNTTATVVEVPVSGNEGTLVTALLAYMVKAANFGKDAEGKKLQAMVEWLSPVANGFVLQGQYDVANPSESSSGSAGVTLESLGLPEELVALLATDLVDVAIAARLGNVYIRVTGRNSDLVGVVKAFEEAELSEKAVSHSTPEKGFGTVRVKYALAS